MDRARLAAEHFRAMDLAFKGRPARNWAERTRDERNEWWEMENAKWDMERVTFNPDRPLR